MSQQRPPRTHDDALFRRPRRHRYPAGRRGGGGSEGQQQPHACRWRFCTAVLPSADALRAHVVAHVDEAHPAGPGPSPGAGARGAATDGVERERERPEPHGEKSFPVLKEGAVLQPPAGHDGA